MRLFARLAAAVLVVAVPLYASPGADAQVTTYRVVGTGDSILHLGAANLTSADRWLELEQGRQIDIRGNQNRASHAEIWPSVLARSRRGGWIIFQDNGGQVTLTRWRQFLAQVVEDTPDDRCILAVLPVAVDPISQATQDDVAAKANIMVQEITKQPCNEFVRWNQKVKADPTLVYDGQHPTPEGSAWLASMIDQYVGYRG